MLKLMIYIYIYQDLKQINGEMDLVDLIKTINAMMQLIRRCWVNSRMKWMEK